MDMIGGHRFSSHVDFPRQLRLRVIFIQKLDPGAVIGSAEWLDRLLDALPLQALLENVSIRLNSVSDNLKIHDLICHFGGSAARVRPKPQKQKVQRGLRAADAASISCHSLSSFSSSTPTLLS